MNGAHTRRWCRSALAHGIDNTFHFTYSIHPPAPGPINQRHERALRIPWSSFDIFTHTACETVHFCHAQTQNTKTNDCRNRRM